MRARRLARLKELFDSEYRHLYLSALAVTRDRSSAEDAVHDALLAVAELDRDIRELGPYLYRVVRNKALHRVRAVAREDSELHSADFLQVDSDNPEAQVLLEQIGQQIELVDSRYRQVLIMKLFFDFTFDEIAQITEKSPNTVATWYRRGLVQLKDNIHAPEQTNELERTRRSTG